MKALILAGGSGSRLKPITHMSAKQLIPVANKPVLFYGLEAIRDAGIRDVGVVVGRTADDIRAAVGDGSAFRLNVTYITQSAPLGLAHGVLIARDYLGADDFVMYLGDNLVMDGIAPLVSEFADYRSDAQVMLSWAPDVRQFGVAELDVVGNVIHLEEKPREPKSNLALTGVYIFSPAVHEAVRHLVPSKRGELEITEAIQWLIDHERRVRATKIKGYWKDAGTVSDVLEANRMLLMRHSPRCDGKVDAETQLKGRVIVEAGAQISSSRVVGPAIIGPCSEVINSHIGPYTSIGDKCSIASSFIERSIIMSGTSIRGIDRIVASLIGKNVEVTPGSAAPGVHCLVLGDHSKVEIGSTVSANTAGDLPRT